MKVQQLLSLLYSALIRYQQILTQIEQYASNPPEELIFKVLIARDAVQDALNKGKSPSESLLLQLADYRNY